MATAAMVDVDPSIHLMKKAAEALKAAIDGNSNDESKQAAIDTMADCITRFDERCKTAKGCIPKTPKPKASTKGKASSVPAT